MELGISNDQPIFAASIGYGVGIACANRPRRVSAATSIPFFLLIENASAINYCASRPRGNSGRPLYSPYRWARRDNRPATSPTEGRRGYCTTRERTVF